MRSPAVTAGWRTPFGTHEGQETRWRRPASPPPPQLHRRRQSSARLSEENRFSVCLVAAWPPVVAVALLQVRRSGLRAREGNGLTDASR